MRGGEIDVEQRHLGAGRCERPRGRGADGAAAAGDDGDLAGERQVFDRAELGLLERPVFHVEHVGLGDRLEAADRFGVGDDVDGAFRHVGGDARVLERAPEAEQPQSRHQHDARQRVDRMLWPPPTRALWRAK